MLKRKCRGGFSLAQRTLYITVTKRKELKMETTKKILQEESMFGGDKSTITHKVYKDGNYYNPCFEGNTTADLVRKDGARAWLGIYKYNSEYYLSSCCDVMAEGCFKISEYVANVLIRELDTHEGRRFWGIAYSNWD